MATSDGALNPHWLDGHRMGLRDTQVHLEARGLLTEEIKRALIECDMTPVKEA